MAFCSNCGKQLADGARFCSSCGFPVAQTSNEESTKRKTMYEGELHKCPNCGESLNSFVAVCPTCGYELRGTKTSSCVKELAVKLEQTKSPAQRDDLIRNFYIPNTKEDICEFLILAVSNIKADDACEDAWRAKLEQAYQKAKLVFNNDPSFEEMEKLYLSASKDVNAEKIVRKVLKNKYSVPLIVLTIGVIMQIIGNIVSYKFYLLGEELFAFAPLIALGMFIYDLVHKVRRK